MKLFGHVLTTGAVLTLLATVCALSPEAQASAWESKTMQDYWSTREVERPLNMGKGWLEVSAGVDAKRSTGYWGPDGERLDFENATWLYTTEYLAVRYGLTRRMEVYGSLLFHYLRLTNDLYGTDTTAFHLGDPHVGVIYDLYRSASPLTSVVAIVDLKMPAGNEAVGSYIGGPGTLSDFVTTTATTDLKLGLAAKTQLGPVAVGGQVGYIHYFSGIAQFVIETEENQFSGRIKPGDMVYLQGQLVAQGGPVAVVITPQFEAHGPTQLGTSSAGLFPDQNLEPVDGSGGWSFGVDTRLIAHASKNADFVLGLHVPLRGEDLMFFPIEDIHPTRGLTWSAAVKVRY
jgi:hypothetical protein